MEVSFFVLRVGAGSISSLLGSEYLGRHVHVLRLWEDNDDAAHDYVLLRGRTHADVVISTEEAGVDVVSTAEVAVEGFPEPTELEVVERSFPETLPPSAAYVFEIEPSGSVPAPWVWCADPCRTFHPRGQHIRT